MPNRTQSNSPAAAETSAPVRGSSRRELLLAGGAGAAGLALAAAPGAAAFGGRSTRGGTQEALNVASTVEVLTTIVTTTALQKVTLPQAAIDTVGAASREELDHYLVLTSQFGGRAATHRVWVPDASFVNTLEPR